MDGSHQQSRRQPNGGWARRRLRRLGNRSAIPTSPPSRRLHEIKSKPDRSRATKSGRFHLLTTEDAAGVIFGRDGAGGSLGQAMLPDRALLSEVGQWTTSGRGGADAAHLLPAAVVQSIGSGGGRSVVRLGGDALLRGHRFGQRASAGRDHGVQVPPPAGRTPVRRADAGSGQPALAEPGSVRITTGTIVDATIIHAPTSTKNREQKRDPEMHQTKKGNQWCVSRTRAQARDAVLKMGDGLPEPAYRSRLQTARCCCVQKAW